MVTCTVISTVFQPLQSIDEDIHNLLTSLRSQVVEVRKDSTHLYSCKIRSILNCQKLASSPRLLLRFLSCPPGFIPWQWAVTLLSWGLMGNFNDLLELLIKIPDVYYCTYSLITNGEHLLWCAVLTRRGTENHQNLFSSERGRTSARTFLLWLGQLLQ